MFNPVFVTILFLRARKPSKPSSMAKTKQENKAAIFCFDRKKYAESGIKTIILNKVIEFGRLKIFSFMPFILAISGENAIISPVKSIIVKNEVFDFGRGQKQENEARGR